jgi:hypothetical protein
MRRASWNWIQFIRSVQKAIFCSVCTPKQCGQIVYFQTKITIWVNFKRSCNGKCW